MGALGDLVGRINGVVWGAPMLVLIVGVGAFLTVRLGFLPIRKIGYGFSLLWGGRVRDGAGDISAFNALMTSLSATIGTGNIAGVATAIAIGGPGALFWMWVTALVGIATKYAEAVLAVRFRETDASGKHIGGPMFYIENGLGANWRWLAVAFALFGGFAAFGIGNMTQSNSIAAALQDNFAVPPLWTAGILIVLVGAVLLGGITRIATWAGVLVPFMAVSYVVLGLAVLLVNAAELPAAVGRVFSGAFTGTAATGGFTGAAVWAAIRFGVARGVFSNEAGLGSAPIAHAAASTTDPVRQGTIAMLGTFIDTLIVCSITGLAIVSSGMWMETDADGNGLTSVTLTASAFDAALPGGTYVVTVSLAIFAFTTILGWSYYGEKCWQYLFGAGAIVYYRGAWIAAVFVGPWALTWEGGARQGIDFIWLLADTLNALMAVPNLVALTLLSPVVLELTRRYYHRGA